MDGGRDPAVAEAVMPMGKRLGLEDTSSGTSSRIIREAVAKGLIKPFDPNTAPRYMKYMPAWG